MFKDNSVVRRFNLIAILQGKWATTAIKSSADNQIVLVVSFFTSSLNEVDLNISVSNMHIVSLSLFYSFN